MKVFDKNELPKVLRYFSNGAGDLFNNKLECVSEKELPEELQKAWEKLWSMNCGSYCYLVLYEGEYGVILVNEYYEKTLEGGEERHNNRDRAFLVGSEFEKAFPDITVVIGDKTGFPHLVDDPATELIVFFRHDADEEKFNKAAKWLYENAYLTRN